MRTKTEKNDILPKSLLKMFNSLNGENAIKITAEQQVSNLIIKTIREELLRCLNHPDMATPRNPLRILMNRKDWMRKDIVS